MLTVLYLLITANQYHHERNRQQRYVYWQQVNHTPAVCCWFVRLSCRLFAKLHTSDTADELATCYGEVSDTSDHLDMSRWSESRQLPRNKLATRPIGLD